MINIADGSILLDMDVEPLGIMVLGNHRAGPDDPGFLR